MIESIGLLWFTVTTSNCPSTPGMMARGPEITFLGFSTSWDGETWGFDSLTGSCLGRTRYRP
ncbi:MAG TPA: hypothetical protein VGH77_29350, partial [Streptosporangiaceae bacterium]